MQLFTNARKSAVETFIGIRWIYREMIPAESRRQLPVAYLLLFITALLQLTPMYGGGKIVDYLQQQNQSAVMMWLGLTIGAMWLSMLCGNGYDFVREHIWNRNYLTSNLVTMHKLLRQTLEDLMRSDNKIGAEHVESIKDRVQNILYLFLFELSLTSVIIINNNLWLLFMDRVAGCAMLLLTMFNIVWFLIWNSEMNEKMEPIDEAFRDASSALVEHVQYATTIKSAGVESEAEAYVRQLKLKPLASDLNLWAFWWQKLELIRKHVNITVPAFVLLYGLTWGKWSGGTFAAILGWIILLNQQFQNIGHMMRHLAANLARLKAAREAFDCPRPFEYDEGIIYEPNQRSR